MHMNAVSVRPVHMHAVPQDDSRTYYQRQVSVRLTATEKEMLHAERQEDFVCGALLESSCAGCLSLSTDVPVSWSCQSVSDDSSSF